jgi:hypothetical protein
MPGPRKVHPTLISIDPGVWACAWAVFQEGVLKNAGNERFPSSLPKTIQNAASWFGGIFAWETYEKLVIEYPQVYQGRFQKGDPNDLIDLSIIVGGIVGSFEGAQGVDLVKPAQWKGQVPKRVTKTRARAALSDEEYIDKLKTADHNIWDAVGIGLWYLRRVK